MQILVHVQGWRTEEAGLVCWRDRNIVYCLSNDSNNHEFDECSRRGNSGIIQIPRPISISKYNKYMGGVDLSDMRRLHCNSTIVLFLSFGRRNIKCAGII
jgi:hypothetical protein